MKTVIAPFLGAVLFFCTQASSRAQGNEWDWLEGTQWYVPAENLLAYLVPGTDFSDPLPIVDQTLWNFTTSSGGIFTGNSIAYFDILGTPVSSSSTLTGVVTPEGQIRIQFIGDETGAETVGIGQFRNVSGGTQMEMQMMTGSGLGYITHWAYMVPIPDPEFDPPTVYPPDTLLSEEWRWMEGTSWSLVAPGVFGTNEAAQFHIESYVNGYFWGSGLGPTDTDNFTQIGSVTPEGNVLFNLLLDGQIISLTGQIIGDGSNGQMALRGYQGTDTFGDLATASVIPEPSAAWLLAGCLLLQWTRRSRRAY